MFYMKKAYQTKKFDTDFEESHTKILVHLGEKTSIEK